MLPGARGVAAAPPLAESRAGVECAGTQRLAVDMTMFTRKPITRTAVNEVVRTGIDAKFSRYVEYAVIRLCRATSS